ncbi:MAG: M16 family metallopeptidase [Treponemataceae bacterium]
MKNLFFFILFFLYTSQCFTQSPKSSSIEYFILENGLELFVVTDDSLPTTTVRLNVKAGYSQQTQNDTGFFELYTKLFLSGSRKFPTDDDIKQELQKLNIISYEAFCSADISYYQLKVPFFSLNETLSLLADATMKVSFFEESVSKQLTAMQNRVLENAEIPATHINTAIDSRLFAQAPWRHETGIAAAVFSKYSAGAARAILTTIKQKFYVPSNSALFISSNLTSDLIYQMVQNTFGDWENSNLPIIKENNLAEKNQIEKDAGLYILHSNDFPQDFIQIITQYSSAGLFHRGSARSFYPETIALSAEAFQNSGSSLKKKMLSSKSLGIDSEEFIHVGYANQGEKSRLIFQTLLEKKNVVLQILEFLNIIKTPHDFLKNTEIEFAKKNLIGNFNEMIQSSPALIDAFANSWTYVDRDYFFDFEKIINSISKNDIQNILTQSPYVFVVMNSRIFFEHEDELKLHAKEIITQKNASWYTNTLYKEIETKKNTELKLAQAIEQDEVQQIHNLLELHKNTGKEIKLANGMNAFVRKNTIASDARVDITFFGGDLLDSIMLKNLQQKQGFRFLTVIALSKLISVQADFPSTASISIDSTLYSHTISIQVASRKLVDVFKSISAALKDSHYTPQIIDQSVWEVRQYLRNKYISNENRMIFDGIQILFEQSKKNSLLYNDKNLFKSLKFADIVKYCEQLQNPYFMQVVVSSTLENDFSAQIIEDNFSDLATTKDHFSFQDFQEAIQSYMFDIKNQQLKIPLQRIFITDSSDSQKMRQPRLLVPTQNFSDPVVIFFQLPSPELENYADIFFMLWNLEEKLKEFVLGGKTPIAKSVDLVCEPNLGQLGYIVFSGVMRPRDLRRSFDRALTLMKNPRTKNEIENKATKKIFMSEIFTQLESTSIYNKYLKTNIFFRNDPVAFFDDLQIINALLWRNASRSMLTWLQTVHFTWIFTEDARL